MPRNCDNQDCPIGCPDACAAGGESPYPDFQCSTFAERAHESEPTIRIAKSIYDVIRAEDFMPVPGYRDRMIVNRETHP